MATTKHTTRPRRLIHDATVRDEDHIIEHALRILESRFFYPREVLDDKNTAANWFRLRLGGLPYEVFAVAWLNRQNRVIAYRELFQGTIDRSDVHIREVVRSALECNASAALFAHNHPSGSGEPSDSDIEITALLRAALHYIRVKMFDHFIVTACEPPFSMAAHGLVKGGRQAMTQARYAMAVA